MDRSTFLALDGESTRRLVTAPYALRANAEGDTLTFDGIASTTDQPYDMYGGTWPGWVETVASGAFKKTLSEGADVAFKINHQGLTLARTKSGTMTLDESKEGLHTVAQLDARMGPVGDLMIASERGDIDEMSFAFRIVQEKWLDDDGKESNDWDGTQRIITEINLNKGDVSAVNYGANPNTSGGFRALEAALAEIRSGRLTEANRALLRSLMDEPERAPTQSQELLDSWLSRRIEFV